jgi:hypothetical protein
MSSLTAWNLQKAVLIDLFREGRQLNQRQALNCRHWPLWTRRLKFPSNSRFRHRAVGAAVQQMLQQEHPRASAGAAWMIKPRWARWLVSDKN